MDYISAAYVHSTGSVLHSRIREGMVVARIKYLLRPAWQGKTANMALIENLLCFRDNVMWQEMMMMRTTKYTADDKPLQSPEIQFLPTSSSYCCFCRPVTSGIIIIMIINFIFPPSKLITAGWS